MAGGVERYMLYNPERKLFLCGSFLDPDQHRAYLFHSLVFARQGLMKSLVEMGDRKSWRIQKAIVDWDQFGDLTQVDVVEEIEP